MMFSEIIGIIFHVLDALFQDTCTPQNVFVISIFENIWIIQFRFNCYRDFTLQYLNPKPRIYNFRKATGL